MILKNEKRRQNLQRIQGSEKKHAVWSEQIWANVCEALALPSTSVASTSIVIGSFEPLMSEPQLPIRADFAYPFIRGEDLVYSHKVKVILVPGLAFCERGYRLGRGKGFFDRFLRANPEVRAIGISYECCVSKEADWKIDSWDLPVSEIITEKRRIIHG
jgi:5,10-methenyltetrahydrofolate synthetase